MPALQGGDAFPVPAERHDSIRLYGRARIDQPRRQDSVLELVDGIPRKIPHNAEPVDAEGEWPGSEGMISK